MDGVVVMLAASEDRARWAIAEALRSSGYEATWGSPNARLLETAFRSVAADTAMRVRVEPVIWVFTAASLTRVQVAPVSVERYTPAPHDDELRPFPSPVPTQTMSLSLSSGSTDLQTATLR